MGKSLATKYVDLKKQGDGVAATRDKNIPTELVVPTLQYLSTLTTLATNSKPAMQAWAKHHSVEDEGIAMALRTVLSAGLAMGAKRALGEGPITSRLDWIRDMIHSSEPIPNKPMKGVKWDMPKELPSLCIAEVVKQLGERRGVTGQVVKVGIDDWDVIVTKAAALLREKFSSISESEATKKVTSAMNLVGPITVEHYARLFTAIKEKIGDSLLTCSKEELRDKFFALAADVLMADEGISTVFTPELIILEPSWCLLNVFFKRFSTSWNLRVSTAKKAEERKAAKKAEEAPKAPEPTKEAAAAAEDDFMDLDDAPAAKKQRSMSDILQDLDGVPI